MSNYIEFNGTDSSALSRNTITLDANGRTVEVLMSFRNPAADLSGSYLNFRNAAGDRMYFGPGGIGNEGVNPVISSSNGNYNPYFGTTLPINEQTFFSAHFKDTRVVGVNEAVGGAGGKDSGGTVLNVQNALLSIGAFYDGTTYSSFRNMHLYLIEIRFDGVIQHRWNAANLTVGDTVWLDEVGNNDIDLINCTVVPDANAFDLTLPADYANPVGRYLAMDGTQRINIIGDTNEVHSKLYIEHDVYVTGYAAGKSQVYFDNLSHCLTSLEGSVMALGVQGRAAVPCTIPFSDLVNTRSVIGLEINATEVILTVDGVEIARDTSAETYSGSNFPSFLNYYLGDRGFLGKLYQLRIERDDIEVVNIKPDAGFTTASLPNLAGGFSANIYGGNGDTMTPFLESADYGRDAVADTVTPTLATYAFGDTITLATSLTGAITATITDSAATTVTLTKNSDTEFVLPAISATSPSTLLEGTVTLTVDNGTDTASTDITLELPTGFTRTTISVTGTPEGTQDLFLVNPATGLIAYNAEATFDADDADIVVNAASGVTLKGYVDDGTTSSPVGGRVLKVV